MFLFASAGEASGACQGRACQRVQGSAALTHLLHPGPRGCRQDKGVCMPRYCTRNVCRGLALVVVQGMHCHHTLPSILLWRGQCEGSGKEHSVHWRICTNNLPVDVCLAHSRPSHTRPSLPSTELLFRATWGHLKPAFFLACRVDHLCLPAAQLNPCCAATYH